MTIFDIGSCNVLDAIDVLNILKIARYTHLNLQQKLLFSCIKTSKNLMKKTL